MATKDEIYYVKSREYDGYSVGTGLHEDVINGFMDRGLDIYLFNKGKMSFEEFSKKMNQPLVSYSNMLGHRTNDEAEFREAMERANPIARQIANKVITEYDTLPSWLKFQKETLVHYQKKLRKVAKGMKVLLLENMSRHNHSFDRLKPNKKLLTVK